jgi:purine-binding chemotaxis protein CheW
METEQDVYKKKQILDELLQMVGFHIAEEEFGVDILQVKEIIRMIEITRVPNTPEFVDGIINLRGSVLPVIDLRTRLGIPRKEHDKNTRIIVVEINKMTIGFVVDAVSEVLRIPRNVTEPPPSMVAGIDSKYITAVGKLENRLLILLDLKQLLSVQEQDALGKAA